VKKSKFLTLVGIAGLSVTLVALLLSSCAKPAPTPTKVIELKYVTEETPTHERVIKVLLPWQKEIETRTNGRVKITFYPSESLTKAPDIADAINTGTVEMGDADIGFTPNRFRLTEAITIPGLGYSDPYNAGMTVWDLYKKFTQVQAEYGGIKVLGLFSYPLDHIYTNKPIKAMADLKGMKIRALPGPGFEAVKLLGGVPVQVNFPDIYQAMEKKNIDGIVVNWTGANAGRFYEITKYATQFAFGGMANYTAINMKVWNSLPADIQKAIEEISGDVLTKRFADFNKVFVGTAAEICKKGGVQEIVLDPAEYQTWVKTVESVPATWANDMNAKGLPGTDVVNYTKERLAYWAKN